jgi:hypothetical protein
MGRGFVGLEWGLEGLVPNTVTETTMNTFNFLIVLASHSVCAEMAAS